MLSPFRYLRPTTAEEATSELSRLGDSAKVYAGGAELLLLMRHGVVEPSHLVDIKHIQPMSRLEWDGQQVRIGATVTHRRVENDPLVRTHLPMLAEAAAQIANVRVRAQGTLGGNLVFADPHADPGTVLAVHDTSVTVGARGGERQMSLDDFLVGTYSVALEPDELLLDVRVSPLPKGWGRAYVRREQAHRPTLNVAAVAEVTDGRLGEVRLAVGCVGPKPMRLTDIERQIRGMTPTEAGPAIESSADYLRELLEPVDDVLGTAEYKLYLTTVLLRRALTQAAGAGPGGNGRAH